MNKPHIKKNGCWWICDEVWGGLSPMEAYKAWGHARKISIEIEQEIIKVMQEELSSNEQSI